MQTERETVKCVQCDSTGAYFKGQLCVRCHAQVVGEKCAKCGSPWVYIHAFMSEKKPTVPLCKPCTYAYIKLCGYMEDVEEVNRRMKEYDDARKEKERPQPEEEAKVAPKKGENQPGML